MIFDEDERKQSPKEEFSLTSGLKVANGIHDRMVEGLKEIKIWQYIKFKRFRYIKMF